MPTAASAIHQCQPIEARSHFPGSTTTQAMPRRVVFHRGRADGHSQHRWSPSGHQAANDKTAFRRLRYKLLIILKVLERAMGFEPTTPTLARLCSTPELHPHPFAGETVCRRQVRFYRKCRRRMQHPLHSFSAGLWMARPGSGRKACSRKACGHLTPDGSGRSTSRAPASPPARCRDSPPPGPGRSAPARIPASRRRRR